MTLNELACEISGLARRVGNAILEIYTTDFAIERKADNSLLTAADIAAHRLIVSHLSALTPNWPILSEESAEISWQERSGWQRYWLIDPLDGTREFVKRNGEFTVNIALIEKHCPILGVVLAPTTEELYCAWEGAGAWLFLAANAEEGQRLRTRPRPTPLVVTGSRSHNHERLEKAVAPMGAYQIMPLGSSLKFCRIARAEADLYVRLGKTCEWDTAAGQYILEQAGGAVVDFSGNPLRYNRQESLINPAFMAYGDRLSNWNIKEDKNVI